MSNTVQKAEKIFDNITNSHLVHEAILFIQNTNGDFSYSKGYGKKELNSPLLMASITKLFTATCIFILREHGKISFDDKLTKYFTGSILKGLHIHKGVEYSSEVTIYDLIFQTSGLPDVYEETSNNLRNRLINQDAYIGFEELIACSKELKTQFAPQIRKKAHYADVNFDILGEIIEKITELPLEQVYKDFIFNPLGLSHTYLPISENDFVPNIYYKDKSIYRPKFIMCSRASGGCISTACELMLFLKAFFCGRLFEENVLSISIYRNMQMTMSPMRYGCGHMQIPLNGVATLFQGKGSLVGHSGSTGSFAFYYPMKDLFFVGDVNQMANPAIPVRFLIQLAMVAK